MRSLLWILCLCLILLTIESAKILCYFAFPSESHQRVFIPLWEAICKRGHSVVVLTPNPQNNTIFQNLTEIDLSSSYEVLAKHPTMIRGRSGTTDTIPNIKKFNMIFDMSNHILEHQFNLPEVKRLFEDRTMKFDLVIVHTYFMPMLYGFSYKYGAPVIGILSSGGLPHLHDSVGDPLHPITHPDIYLNYGSKLNFWQRWWSVLTSVLYRLNYYYYLLPKADQVARRYFGEKMPNLFDIERNVSMQFVNTNPLIYAPRPTIPTFVELRMMHLRPSKPLPEDLQEFLDSAKDGAVYFSLGSNVKSSLIDERLRDIIVAALSELPYKVLWKWESDYLPGKPANVMTRKWLPQQDILAHPNVKAFVTQGGLQSTEEALAHAVPLVGIPFLADQPMNVLKLAEHGVAIALDKNTLTKEQLRDSIIEVATNQKYKERAKELRDILNDEPMPSLDKAVWWCEYIIRHEGARFLRSPALDLPLYQYFLLDVIGATLLTLIIGIYIVYKVISLLLRLIFGKKQKIKKN